MNDKLDASNLIKLLGVTSENALMQDLLSNMGVYGDVKLDEGDPSKNIDSKENGLGLVLRDKHFFLGVGDAVIGGDICLVGFFMYSKRHEGFSEYMGEMPVGLLFSDNEAEVLSKLGQPELTQQFEDGTIRKARWALEGGSVWLFVTFKKKRKGILIVSYQKRGGQ